MSRGPFTQTRFRPELDCSKERPTIKGNRGHTWHIPLYPPDRDTYCSKCGKVRKGRKKT